MALDIEAIIWTDDYYGGHGVYEGLHRGFLGFTLSGKAGAYIIADEEDIRHDAIISMVRDYSKTLITDKTGDWYIYDGELVQEVNKMFNMDDLCFLVSSGYKVSIA